MFISKKNELYNYIKYFNKLRNMSADPFQTFLEKNSLVLNTFNSMVECIRTGNMDTFWYLIKIDKTLLIDPSILNYAIRYNNLEVLKILAEIQDLQNNRENLHFCLILAAIESNVEINKFMCQIVSNLHLYIIDFFCKALIRDHLDLEVCKFYMSKIDEFQDDKKISFENIPLDYFYSCTQNIITVKWVFSKYDYEKNIGIYVDMLNLVQERKVPEDVKAFVIQEIEPVIQKMDSESKEPEIKKDTIAIPVSFIEKKPLLFAQLLIMQLVDDPSEDTIVYVIDMIKSFHINLNDKIIPQSNEPKSVYWFAITMIDLKIVERLLQVCPVNANDELVFESAADYPKCLALYEKYKQ